MNIMRWISLSFILFTSFSTGYAITCSNNQLQKCETTIAYERTKDETSLSQLDLMKLCSNLRSSMNCVMNYSVNCLKSEERFQTGDLILLTRKHIYYVCEEEDAIEEYWKGGECYGKDEIKKCDDDFEERLKERGLTKKPSAMSCRHYVNYQQCIQTVVEEKCSSDDKVYIGTYLVDQGDSLSWVCTDDFSNKYISTISPTSGRGSFKGYGCLTKLKNKLDECTKEFKRVEETSLEDSEQEQSKEPSRKEYCCAYYDFIDCVDSAAKVQCDRNGQRFVQHVLDQTRMTSGDYCSTYGGLSLQCSIATHPFQPSEFWFLVLLVLSLSWKYGCTMFTGNSNPEGSNMTIVCLVDWSRAQSYTMDCLCSAYHGCRNLVSRGVSAVPLGGPI